MGKNFSFNNSIRRLSPKYWYILVLLLVALATATYLLFFSNAQPITYTVAIDSSGFSPQDLKIKQGDTVLFINTDKKPSWPASDPHPTHENLPGFDPDKPVKSGERWSYTFTQSGIWRYHDHLSPFHKGTIVVQERSAGILRSGQVKEGYCDGECFDERIRQKVKEEGIEAAYELFIQAFEEGQLPRSCHWTAHQIGEAAYELFREGKKVPISKATSYCGYGFYHGFLEGLLREKPEVSYALSFCKQVEEQLGQLGLWNCYHGIGHGFTEDPPDPRTHGNFQAMIQPGIDMCEYLFGSSFRDLNLCLTGVFTVPAGFAEKGEYGLALNPDDPFASCKTQPYRYQKACYGEFAPKLDSLPDWNLSRLPGIIASIHDEKTQRLIVWTVPSVMMARYITEPDYDIFIRGCTDHFIGTLRNICIGGSVLGFFSHGEPERQYLQAFDFCAAPAWGDDERRVCYQETFHRVRQEYPAGRLQEVCNAAPARYQQACTSDGYIPVYDDPSFETS